MSPDPRQPFPPAENCNSMHRAIPSPSSCPRLSFRPRWLLRRWRLHVHPRTGSRTAVRSALSRAMQGTATRCTRTARTVSRVMSPRGEARGGTLISGAPPTSPSRSKRERDQTARTSAPTGEMSFTRANRPIARGPKHSGPGGACRSRVACFPRRDAPVARGLMLVCVWGRGDERPLWTVRDLPRDGR